MPFLPVVGLGSLIFVFVNFLRALTNRDWKAAVTQVISWVSGVVAVLIAAHSDWAAAISFGDRTLAVMNGWSQLFVGLLVASLAGVTFEIKKAIDGSDSASEPSLVPPSTTT